MYSSELIERLNEDIKQFPEVHSITQDMVKHFDGVSRTVMLDRYTFKDLSKKTLKAGDFVVLTVKEDPKYPTRGFGIVDMLTDNEAVILVEEEFRGNLEGKEAETGRVVRRLEAIEKPLELFYEQVALRNATGLASVEKTEAKRKESFENFYKILSNLDFVPAGRVLYGAGAGTDVTYFNCYVMPYPQDSRDGIADHRKKVMEIMSRGGGVGTNGSTLRPRNALARGVNGKSSGSVSWLNDIANLTNLVEQGGSRRGAQMIMLASWHADILEFIISKMQNPRILRFIIENTKDAQIKQLAKDKLKFTPLKPNERMVLENAQEFISERGGVESDDYKYIEQQLADGGTYSVHNPEFLTGANISVCLTKDFMEAVENDTDYALRFPDVDNYSKEEMAIYNEKWHDVGDVREWERLGHKVRTYRTIKAKELWTLINTCATYSAEPGIFFIDNANEKTNAVAYNQKVVATNPCGEQPLAPFSVCNLSAVNLSNFGNGEKGVDFERLAEVVKIGVRMQDNVIDATPYFMEENTKQAQAERRVGLGVMGLHDLLIKCETIYGSKEGNELVDKVFETIAVSAYEASIELAKEKGSFPYLQGADKEEDLDLRLKFVGSGYMTDMPAHIKQDILKYGIRNSHLLTVAPTGSTGTMVGCSTGLEPYFSFKYYRSGRLGKFIPVVADIALEWLKENGYEPNEDNVEEMVENLPEWFISTMELSPEAHVDTQCVIQRWVDSSLSKTVNAPKGYSIKQVEAIYERLHKGGAKGGTVYVDGSRDSQVLSLTAEENNMDDVQEVEVDATWEVELAAEEVVYGNEHGNTCPICKTGTVIESGGCNTCNNCNAQLKCGL
jgi:ribonucleoside-diphosphate reductase alpha chain